MNRRQLLGRQGEDLATRYLAKQGYRILEQRYRCKAGEIDIIAVDHKTLVFIEVKTRSSIAYGLPAEAVTYNKQQKIRQLALLYMQEGKHNYQSIRFDVISVLLNHDGHQLEHIKDAF